MPNGTDVLESGKLLMGRNFFVEERLTVNRCQAVTTAMTLSRGAYDSSGIDAEFLHLRDQRRAF